MNIKTWFEERDANSEIQKTKEHLLKIAPELGPMLRNYNELLEALKDVASSYRTFRTLILLPNVPKEKQEWTSTDDNAIKEAFAVIKRAER